MRDHSRGAIFLFAILLLTSCSQVDSASIRNGPNIDFPQTVITETLQRQSDAVDQFIRYSLGPELRQSAMAIGIWLRKPDSPMSAEPATIIYRTWSVFSEIRIPSTKE
jgi:hypothetical protein